MNKNRIRKRERREDASFESRILNWYWELRQLGRCKGEAGGGGGHQESTRREQSRGKKGMGAYQTHQWSHYLFQAGHDQKGFVEWKSPPLL